MHYHEILWIGSSCRIVKCSIDMWVADIKEEARGQATVPGLIVFYFMLLLLLNATGISTWALLSCLANRAKKKPEKESRLGS